MKWSMICWLDACRTLEEDKFSGLSSGGVGGGADMLAVTETSPLTDEEAAAADFADAMALVADPTGS